MILLRILASNGRGHVVKTEGSEKDDGRTLSWNNSQCNRLPSSCLSDISPVNWATPEYGCHPHPATEAPSNTLPLNAWCSSIPSFSEVGCWGKVFLWIAVLTFFTGACDLSRALCNLSSCCCFCCLSFSSLSLLKGANKGWVKCGVRLHQICFWHAASTTHVTSYFKSCIFQCTTTGAQGFGYSWHRNLLLWGW